MAPQTEGPIMSANAGNIPTVTPLPFTASGRLTSNVLLVKDYVGKTRPSVFSLPGLNHVYGKRVERDPNECAATVLQHWHVRALSKNSTPALDYIAMNRNSAKQGIISPKQIRAYRKLHPVRMHTESDESHVNNVKIVDGGNALYRKAPVPSDVDPWFTYGKPTRPSTPVAALMTDKYQREWLEQQEKRLNERTNVSLKVKAKKKKHTKKSTAETPSAKTLQADRPSIASRDPFTLWKMSKFTKTPAHINSWRSNDDPALDYNHELDTSVFKVVNDKWLGLQPRELTRPIYMQGDLDRQARSVAAVAAEPLKKGKKMTNKKDRVQKKEAMQKKEANEKPLQKTKEVRFVVEDWKNPETGEMAFNAVVPKSSEIPQNKKPIESTIKTTESHVTPSTITTKTTEFNQSSQDEEPTIKTTHIKSCPPAGTATIETAKNGSVKTITEVARDPATGLEFRDTYAPGSAPVYDVAGLKKPAPVDVDVIKGESSLPVLPKKTGEYSTVEGVIKV